MIRLTKWEDLKGKTIKNVVDYYDEQVCITFEDDTFIHVHSFATNSGDGTMDLNCKMRDDIWSEPHEPSAEMFR